jgi:hypothetical protein
MKTMLTHRGKPKAANQSADLKMPHTRLMGTNSTTKANKAVRAKFVGVSMRAAGICKGGGAIGGEMPASEGVGQWGRYPNTPFLLRPLRPLARTLRTRRLGLGLGPRCPWANAPLGAWGLFISLFKGPGRGRGAIIAGVEAGPTAYGHLTTGHFLCEPENPPATIAAAPMKAPP